MPKAVWRTVLPIFDAVTLAEYLECLDVCLGIVYQYAVHIEQDSPYHFVVFESQK